MRLIYSIALVVNLLFSTVVRADENTYSKPTIGLKITKPESWHWTTAAEVQENLERVQHNDESLDKLIKSRATAPLVAMTKYKEPFDDLNPSVKLNVKPLVPSLSADDPVKILEICMTPFSKAFADMKVVTKPKETELAGLKAAYTCIDYTLVTADGQEFPTRSRMWIVPRGKMFFMIGTGMRQDGRTGKRAELDKIIESIHIEPEAEAKQPTGP